MKPISEKVFDKYKKENGEYCPSCASDRVDTEGFEIIGLGVIRKMHCMFCKNEWNECYDLRTVQLTTDRPMPCSTEEEAWLHGKKTVVFEYPSNNTSEADEVMITDPNSHGKDWWESMHNMIPSHFNIEEEIDGQNSKQEDVRYTKADYSYHEGEANLEMLRVRGVPETLVSKFAEHLKMETTYLELVWCHEDDTMHIHTVRHAREHLSYDESYGEESGNKYDHAFLKYIPGTKFNCEDQDALELKTRGDGTDIPCVITQVLRNTLWLEKGKWVRFTGSTCEGNAIPDHYYIVHEVWMPPDLMDATIQIVVDEKLEEYPARDFCFEPEVADMDRYAPDRLVVSFGSIFKILERKEDKLICEYAIEGIADSPVTVTKICAHPINHIIKGDNDTLFFCNVNGYVEARVYGPNADRGDDDQVYRFNINEYRIKCDDQWSYDMYYGSIEEPMPIDFVLCMGQNNEHIGERDVKTWERQKKWSGNPEERFGRMDKEKASTQLAKAFAKELAKDMGLPNLVKVVTYNKDRDNGCCASHDYCDPNMTMDRAWKKVFGYPMQLGHEDHIFIMNEAWSEASKAEFYVNDKTEPAKEKKYPSDMKHSIHHLSTLDILHFALNQIEEYSENDLLRNHEGDWIKEPISEIYEWIAVKRAQKPAWEELPSFKAFRESRRHCAADSEIYGPGYSGACFRYGDDAAEIAIEGPEGQFWLVIENQEYFSHNLVELEIELYLWRYL